MAKCGRLSLTTESLTLDANGTKIGEMKYYPFGEARYVNGNVGTDRHFTGQREDSYINLYEMGAWWYSPVLGRWLSPDTIVPDPANPQSLNRYSYVNNRPLSFTDPSGYVDCDKNQWGDTCQSSTAAEKDDADAHNNLCTHNPAACQYNTKEVATVLELLGSVLLEPIDWALTTPAWVVIALVGCWGCCRLCQVRRRAKCLMDLRMLVIWWFLRQTIWNVRLPAGWRLVLIGLEICVVIEFVVVDQPPEPIAARVLWSFLSLMVFSAFAYYFDHRRA